MGRVILVASASPTVSSVIWGSIYSGAKYFCCRMPQEALPCLGVSILPTLHAWQPTAERQRCPKLPPSLVFQNHSAAAIQTNFIFLFGSCISLKPTNNQNQIHPPQMCVGEKQRGVKHMAQLHNPFSPWVHFSWHYSITSWPYLQINNYWKNMAGPHMRIFHSCREKLCVGWWLFIFTRGGWVCCHVFRALSLEVLSLLSLQRLQEELRVGTSCTPQVLGLSWRYYF